MRGLNSVISWVHLYQWGDATDVRGDVDAKRLGTPALKVPMAFWRDTYGITYEPEGLWGTPKVLGDEKMDWGVARC
jgi:hypothetical protein